MHSRAFATTVLIHTHTCPSRSAALNEAEFTVFSIPKVRAGLFSRPGARLSSLCSWPTEALALVGSASGDDGFSGLPRVTLLQVVQWGLPPPRDADEVGTWWSLVAGVALHPVCPWGAHPDRCIVFALRAVSQAGVPAPALGP